MDKHISLLATFYVGLSIVGLFVAGIIFFILFGTGIISQNQEAFLILTTVGTIISFFFIITSIPGIIGGIGLFKRKNWARILVLILSAIKLFDIPLGTALGIYAFWVLLQDETVKLFENKRQD
ncbi:hypothetical protein ACFL40_00005 [candidate division KSB1 bacterium]